MTIVTLPKILTFKPEYIPVIWGGHRISELKGETIDCKNVGESWEISAIEGHETSVNSGELSGIKITELARIYGSELLGERVTKRFGNNFPLLIKLIDARDILSVQVHPNDAVAARRHNGHGKAEMWYVIDAEKDAKIYCGLDGPLTPDDYLKRIDNKSIMDVVAMHKSEPGQFYYIPSGTIHSIGAGNLLAEIQQSSNITYRVFDHNRLDSTGKARELHTDAAREAIDYSYPHNVNPTARIYEGSIEKAVECEHFIVDYYRLSNDTAIIKPTIGSFTVIMVVNGALTITADDQQLKLSAGHTALIPANVNEIAIEGSGVALSAHL